MPAFDPAVARPAIDLRFPHSWEAEVLAKRPLIVPKRHFVYPRDVEEAQTGALELLVRPLAKGIAQEHGPEFGAAAPFLATCALGFRDSSVPTGLWSCPNENDLCALSGGYAYIIDVWAPECFTMIAYRPVFAVCAMPAEGLLLFVGNRSILALGHQGVAWESERLSDEGVTMTAIENQILHGLGWKMLTDKEEPFALDLRTGRPLRT